MKTASGMIVCLIGLLVADGSARAEEKKMPEIVRAVLSQPDQVEVLSLNPSPEKEKDGDKDKDTFHGYKVLGKTALKEAKQRKELVDALVAGIQEKATPARCFIPRHGLRVTSDRKTIEMVICFECAQVKVFDGAAMVWSSTVGKSPEPAFDKVLKDAGIPKAK
jgi:hypothetical protein